MNRLRITSFILCVTFLGQDLAFAVPTPAPAPVIAPAALPAMAFRLPESVAQIEDGYAAPHASKTIFLFQDAHTNESGQINLAKTLKEVLPAEGITHVFTEASQGDMSVGYFKRVFDPRVMEPVAMSYLRKGVLKGDEYLGLTSDLNFTIWGVEDPALYDAALEAYKKVADQRVEVLGYLDRLTRTSQALKEILYSPELKKIDSARAAYLKGEMPLTDYFEALHASARKTGVYLPQYPHLSRLKTIRALESRIDFQAASAQQEKAVESLPAQVQADLRNASQKNHSPFRLAGDDHAADKGFYALLESSLRTAGSEADSRAAAAYPELFKYFAYLKASRQIDAPGVLDEIKALERDVFGRLARTDDAALLIKLSGNLETLTRMIELKLTPDEFTAYRRDQRSFDIRIISGFFNKKIMDLSKHYDRTVLLDKEYAAASAAAEKFYELAMERDQVFLSETLKKMDSDGLQKAVLVTGGFHTPHLKELLKRKGISYVSIQPQVSHETNTVRYEDLLFKQLASAQKATRLARSRTLAPVQNAAMTAHIEMPIPVVQSVKRALIRDFANAAQANNQSVPADLGGALAAARLTPFELPQSRFPRGARLASWTSEENERAVQAIYKAGNKLEIALDQSILARSMGIELKSDSEKKTENIQHLIQMISDVMGGMYTLSTYLDVPEKPSHQDAPYFLHDLRHAKQVINEAKTLTAIIQNHQGPFAAREVIDRYLDEAAAAYDRAIAIFVPYEQGDQAIWDKNHPKAARLAVAEFFKDLTLDLWDSARFFARAMRLPKDPVVQAEQFLDVIDQKPVIISVSKDPSSVYHEIQRWLDRALIGYRPEARLRIVQALRYDVDMYSSRVEVGFENPNYPGHYIRDHKPVVTIRLSDHEAMKRYVRGLGDIVFIGPPGAGKGEQSKWLKKEFGAIVVGTGNFFRGADLMLKKGIVSDEDPNLETFVDKSRLEGIYKQINAIIDEGRVDLGDMSKGRLIDDAVTIKIVNYLLSLNEYAKAPMRVMDGFPRTPAQWAAVEQGKVRVGGEKGPLLRMGLTIVMDFSSPEVMRSAIARRFAQRAGRADADKAIERIEAYNQGTKALVDSVRFRANTVQLEADDKIGADGLPLDRQASIDLVTRDLVNAINELRANGARLAQMNPEDRAQYSYAFVGLVEAIQGATRAASQFKINRYRKSIENEAKVLENVLIKVFHAYQSGDAPDRSDIGPWSSMFEGDPGRSAYDRFLEEFKKAKTLNGDVLNYRAGQAIRDAQTTLQRIRTRENESRGARLAENADDEEKKKAAPANYLIKIIRQYDERRKALVQKTDDANEIVLPDSIQKRLIASSQNDPAGLVGGIMRDEEAVKALVSTGIWGSADELRKALNDAAFGDVKDVNLSRSLNQIAHTISRHLPGSSINLVLTNLLQSRRSNATEVTELSHQLIHSYDPELSENLRSLLSDEDNIQLRAFSWLFNRMILEAEQTLHDRERAMDHFMVVSLILKQMNTVMGDNREKWRSLQAHIIMTFAERIAEESKQNERPFMSAIIQLYPSVAGDLFRAIDSQFANISKMTEEKQTAMLRKANATAQTYAQAIETILSFGVMAWPVEFYNYLQSRYAVGDPQMKAQYLNAMKYGISYALAGETSESRDVKRQSFILENTVSLVSERHPFIHSRLNQVMDYIPDEFVDYLLEGNRYVNRPELDRSFLIEFLLRVSTLDRIENGRARVLPMVMSEITRPDISITIQAKILFSDYFSDDFLKQLTSEQGAQIRACILNGYEEFRTTDVLADNLKRILRHYGSTAIAECFAFYEQHRTTNMPKAVRALLLGASVASSYDAAGKAGEIELFGRVLDEVLALASTAASDKQQEIEKYYRLREDLNKSYSEWEGLEERTSSITSTAQILNTKVEELDTEIRDAQKGIERAEKQILVHESNVEAAKRQQDGIRDQIRLKGLLMRVYSWFWRSGSGSNRIIELQGLREDLAEAIANQKFERSMVNTTSMRIAAYRNRITKLEEKRKEAEEKQTQMAEAYNEVEKKKKSLKEHLDWIEGKLIPDTLSAIDSFRSACETYHEALRLFNQSPTMTEEMAGTVVRDMTVRIGEKDGYSAATLAGLAVQPRFSAVADARETRRLLAEVLLHHADRGMFRMEVQEILTTLIGYAREGRLVPEDGEDPVLKATIDIFRDKRFAPDAAVQVARITSQLVTAKQKHDKTVLQLIRDVAKVSEVSNSGTAGAMTRFLENKFPGAKETVKMLSWIFILMVVFGKDDEDDMPGQKKPNKKTALEKAVEGMFAMLSGEEGMYFALPDDLKEELLRKPEITAPKSRAELIEMRYSRYFKSLAAYKKFNFESRQQIAKLEEGFGWDRTANGQVLDYWTVLFNRPEASEKLQRTAESALVILALDPWAGEDLETPSAEQLKLQSNKKLTVNQSFPVHTMRDYAHDAMPFQSADIETTHAQEPKIVGRHRTRYLARLAYYLSKRVIGKLETLQESNLEAVLQTLEKFQSVIGRDIHFDDGHKSVNLAGILDEAVKQLRKKLRPADLDTDTTKRLPGIARFALPPSKPASDAPRIQGPDSGQSPEGARLAQEGSGAVKVLYAAPMLVKAVNSVRTIAQSFGGAAELVEEFSDKADEAFIRAAIEKHRPAVAIFRSNVTFTPELIAFAKQYGVRELLRAGAGYDNVDFEASVREQISLATTGGNAEAVAYLSMRFLLAALGGQEMPASETDFSSDPAWSSVGHDPADFVKALASSDKAGRGVMPADLSDAVFKKLSVDQVKELFAKLQGKTISLLAFGPVAQAFAKKLQKVKELTGMNFTVLAYSPALASGDPSRTKAAADLDVQIAKTKQEAIGAADYLSIHYFDKNDPVKAEELAGNQKLQAVLNTARLHSLDLKEALPALLDRGVRVYTDADLAKKGTELPEVAEFKNRYPDYAQRMVLVPHIGAFTKTALDGVEDALRDALILSLAKLTDKESTLAVTPGFTLNVVNKIPLLSLAQIEWKKGYDAARKIIAAPSTHAFYGRMADIAAHDFGRANDPLSQAYWSGKAAGHRSMANKGQYSGSGARLASKAATDKLLAALDPYRIAGTEKARTIRDNYTKHPNKNLNSFVPRSEGNESGRYISLDFGGTNFRVLIVDLKNGKVVRKKIHSLKIPKPLTKGDSDQFFGFIAREIKKVMAKEKMNPAVAQDLGFAFAFPVNQIRIDQGILDHWTKEFDVKGVVGEEVVGLLLRALEKEGLRNIRVTALANDTVGTLVTMPEASLGVILGTGTNAAYWDEATGFAVNTEWGGFKGAWEPAATEADRIMDRRSEKPGEQLFEKMVSGKYLGEIARAQINLFRKDGFLKGKKFSRLTRQGGVTTPMLSEILEDRTKTLARVGRYFPGTSASERKVIRAVARAIFTRSADLFVEATYANLKLSGAYDSPLPLVVAIDGSLYGKSKFYRRQVRRATLLHRAHWWSRPVRYVQTSDGSGIGTARIAAIASAVQAQSSNRTAAGARLALVLTANKLHDGILIGSGLFMLLERPIDEEHAQIRIIRRRARDGVLLQNETRVVQYEKKYGINGVQGASITFSKSEEDWKGRLRFIIHAPAEVPVWRTNILEERGEWTPGKNLFRRLEQLEDEPSGLTLGVPVGKSVTVGNYRVIVQQVDAGEKPYLWVSIDGEEFGLYPSTSYVYRSPRGPSFRISWDAAQASRVRMKIDADRSLVILREGVEPRPAKSEGARLANSNPSDWRVDAVDHLNNAIRRIKASAVQLRAQATVLQNTNGGVVDRNIMNFKMNAEALDAHVMTLNRLLRSLDETGLGIREKISSSLSDKSEPIRVLEAIEAIASNYRRPESLLGETPSYISESAWRSGLKDAMIDLILLDLALSGLTSYKSETVPIRDGWSVTQVSHGAQRHVLMIRSGDNSVVWRKYIWLGDYKKVSDFVHGLTIKRIAAGLLNNYSSWSSAPPMSQSKLDSIVEDILVTEFGVVRRSDFGARLAGSNPSDWRIDAAGHLNNAVRRVKASAAQLHAQAMVLQSTNDSAANAIAMNAGVLEGHAIVLSKLIDILDKTNHKFVKATDPVVRLMIQEDSSRILIALESMASNFGEQAAMSDETSSYIPEPAWRTGLKDAMIDLILLEATVSETANSQGETVDLKDGWSVTVLSRPARYVLMLRSGEKVVWRHYVWPGDYDNIRIFTKFPNISPAKIFAVSLLKYRPTWSAIPTASGTRFTAAIQHILASELGITPRRASAARLAKNSTKFRKDRGGEADHRTRSEIRKRIKSARKLIKKGAVGDLRNAQLQLRIADKAFGSVFAQNQESDQLRGKVAGLQQEISRLMAQMPAGSRLAVAQNELEPYLTNVAAAINLRGQAELALSDGDIAVVIDLVQKGAQVSWKFEGDTQWLAIEDPNSGTIKKISSPVIQQTRLNAENALKADLTVFELFLAAAKELNLPIQPVNYRLNVTQMLSAIDAENRADIVEKLKVVLSRAHKQGLGSFFYAAEDAAWGLPQFERAKDASRPDQDAPETTLRDLKALNPEGETGYGIFYKQNKNEFIPLMSTLLAQNLLTQILGQPADTQEAKDARSKALATLEPIFQKLTRSTIRLSGSETFFTGVPANANADAYDPYSVKGLSLRGYIDLLVYLQGLRKATVDVAA